jgi:hypothetical protein
MISVCFCVWYETVLHVMMSGSQSSRIASEIDLSRDRILGQLLARPLKENAALEHDVGPVGGAQGLAHVVIGDQDAQPLRLQSPDDVLDLRHGERIDPDERLVEQQVPRTGHQGPRDLDAAPLAARQMMTLAVREVRDVQLLEQLFEALGALPARERQGLQNRQDVFPHRQAPEDRRLLLQIADSEPGPLVHRRSRDVGRPP